MRRRHQQLDFEGSVHFVTTVTRTRGRWFVDADVCRNLLLLLEKYRIRNHVICFGYVLMPDHLHALLLQERIETTVSNLMGDFKRETSKRIRISDYPVQELWRERYDDVPVPGSEAAITKLQYMLNNPVRNGLVSNSCDYLWSSARDHYDVGKGIVTVEKI